VSDECKGGVYFRDCAQGDSPSRPGYSNGRAAITGHLGLSSIHTNDAVSTILRLVDMGVPGYMVATSVVGIISQRLVRVVCQDCKESYMPEKAQLDAAHISPQDAAKIDFQRGKGCMACGHKGYRGRRAVHEVLIFNHAFRALVHANASVEVMRECAVKDGMQTLQEAAMVLLKAGITSVDEIIDIVHGL